MRVGVYALNSAASEVLLEQLVEKRKWMTLEDFSKLMSLATLIPGPYHVNLVILTGYSLGGVRSGIIAAISFIIPGFLLASIAAHLLSLQDAQAWLQAHPGFTTGMLAAASGLVLCIIVKLGQRSLPARSYWLLVFALAALLWYFRLPFALAIIGCGVTALAIRVVRKK